MSACHAFCSGWLYAVTDSNGGRSSSSGFPDCPRVSAEKLSITDPSSLNYRNSLLPLLLLLLVIAATVTHIALVRTAQRKPPPTAALLRHATIARNAQRTMLQRVLILLYVWLLWWLSNHGHSLQKHYLVTVAAQLPMSRPLSSSRRMSHYYYYYY
jgi:hypothetical protein